jgi:signal transduction histidine kinase
MYGTVGCYLILSTLATQGIIKVSLSKLQLRVEFLHAVYFAGIAGELLCFALGLGYKQQLLEKEKQSALQRLVEQQSDMNQHLEELVKSRTAVIQEQKEEIVAQNEELVQQGEELATQRDLLEDQNRIIAKHNRQLEEQVAARTQALMIKADELERQNQQLEQFSHITAHNLRGPVARILGLTNLFDSSHLPAPDNAIIVDKLRVSAQDLDVIIREMSNIVNIQRRNVTLEKVELAPIIKNIITRLKEANLDNYGLKLNLGISVVNAVPSYLESILFHIISNSVKFKNVGTSVSIWIDTVQDRERTKLTIRDDGPGFDQEKLASKLFQPFQRFNLTHSGNGIGLFLVKTQVEAIGGEIKLESAVSRGVTVNIWFSRQ